MKTKLLLILLLVMPGIFLQAQTCNNKMGVNLDGIGGIAFEFPDVMKTAGKPRNFPSPSRDANTDASGWPTEDCQITFFDHRPFGAWAPPADDPAKYVVDLSGVYTLTFTGQADLSSWSDAPLSWAELNTGKVYNAATNTTTVTITWPSTTSSGGWKYGYFVLNFTNTKATPASSVNTGIKNIKMIRPGYAGNTTQVFRKEFLDAISIFSTIRFMDWTHTNNNGPSAWSATNYTRWSDRQKPDVYPYTKGAPWETVIDLINMTGKDIWINIPQAADDDYVTELATLMKNRLRPDVNIYLEYSNEVWNGGFNQFDYNYSAVLNSPGEADIRASTSFDDRRRARRVAKRVIRIGQIFENVMGVTVASRTRLRPVFAWQIGGWLPWYEDVLNWINTTYGAPKNYIYAISSAPYFNDGGFGATETPQQIVARMSANSDANVNAIKTLAQYAATWNILHLQYEGGPDNGGGDPTNIGNRITANRIPEMKTAVIHNYQDNWFSAAAHGTAPLGTNDLANYFVMSGKVSRYGCWGATEDLAYLNDLSKAPKYDALCALTGKCTNVPSVSISAPANNGSLNVGTAYSITTNVTAPSAVSKVEYFIGSTLLGSDNSSPYSFSWTPSAIGRYSIYAKVIDVDCKYRFADPVEVTVNSVLGVQSLNLSAVRADEEVKLIWQVEGEENVSHYIIERSFERGSFIEVGRVQAGNFRSYYFTDLNTSDSYYRIKTIDLDGSVEYSEIIFVEGKEENEVIIYPNPTNGIVNIRISEYKASGNYYCEIVNSMGSTIKSMPLINGSIVLDTKDFPVGVYFVKVRNELNYFSTRSMIVIH